MDNAPENFLDAEGRLERVSVTPQATDMLEKLKLLQGARQRVLC